MAEAYGAGLLSEVHEERLDETLRTLCELNNKLQPKQLGIPTLDSLIRESLSPHQDRQGRHDATQQVPAQVHISAQGLSNKINRPPVIQISGLSPCSGKTQLLYRIAAQCLLSKPKQPNSMLGGVVIWIDNDNRFSIQRLYRISKTFVAYRLKSNPRRGQNSSDLATAALRNLHVFRPQSHDAFSATVQSLKQHLLDPKAHPSFGYTVEAVVVSNISAFFWEDRQERERQTYPQSSSTAVPEPFDYTRRWRMLVTQLSEIQSMFGCIVAVSNACMFPTTVTNSQPAVRTNVPALWSNFVTLELIVAKDPITRFRRGLSAEEALLASKHRDSSSQKGFTGWVARLVPTERDPTPSVLESVGNGSFRFKVDDDSVTINE